MTPEQCRAARAWLGFSQVELVKRARVGLSTVIYFESGFKPLGDTKTLEKRGIRFLNGATTGIAFAKPSRKKTRVQVNEEAPPA